MDVDVDVDVAADYTLIPSTYVDVMKVSSDERWVSGVLHMELRVEERRETADGQLRERDHGIEGGGGIQDWVLGQCRCGRGRGGGDGNYAGLEHVKSTGSCIGERDSKYVGDK